MFGRSENTTTIDNYDDRASPWTDAGGDATVEATAQPEAVIGDSALTALVPRSQVKEAVETLLSSGGSDNDTPSLPEGEPPPVEPPGDVSPEVQIPDLIHTKFGPQLPLEEDIDLVEAVWVDDMIVFEAEIPPPPAWPLSYPNGKACNAMGYVYRITEEGLVGGKTEWVSLANKDFFWDHNLYEEGGKYYNPVRDHETVVVCLVSTDGKKRSDFVTVVKD